MQDSEKTKVNEFSPREIASVVGVVDTKLKGSDVIIGSVTPENVGDFVDEFTKFREQRRQQLNEENCIDMSAVELIAEKRGRSCEPHAIQCDIQGAKDAEFIIEELEKRKGPEGIVEMHQIVLFFKREIKLRDSLAQFHRVDISRRIGDFKKNDSFYVNEKERFEKALSTLPKILKEFEKENSEKIHALPDEHRKQILSDLFNLQNISPDSFDNLKSSFYEEICERIGRLIGTDFEMNVPGLMVAAEKLWKIESKKSNFELKKEAYLKNFEPEDSALAEFCFDHGIVELRGRYTNLIDTLSWLMNYSPSAANDFLTTSAKYEKCPALVDSGQMALMQTRAQRTLNQL